MSWKGFVKGIDRNITSILQSTGSVEKTIDKEYEGEELKLKNLETKLETLHKEAKGYLDAVRATTLVLKNNNRLRLESLQQ
jgi:amphiphysin